MLLAHKIALRPNKVQIDYFQRACGTARFAYNWGLARYKELLDQRKAGVDVGKLGHRRLRDELVALKKTTYPWLTEVSKHVVSNAFENLGCAIDRFFKSRGSRRKSGFPQFKCKGRSKDSFTIDRNNDSTIVLKGQQVRLPVIGWIRLKEELRFQCVVKRVTISREADRWFAAFLVDVGDANPYEQCRDPDAVVGVDLGIKTLATLSTGEVFENPKVLNRFEKRLARQARNLSRKTKCGMNYKRAKAKLARTHAKIANVRKDALHKLTTYLALNFNNIVSEDLAVGNMLKNRKLARAIADAGFGLFKSMLAYKTVLRGSASWFADRFYPSTKTCSCCGAVRDHVSLSERTFVCPSCGFTLDRDANASINLEKLFYAEPLAA